MPQNKNGKGEPRDRYDLQTKKNIKPKTELKKFHPKIDKPSLEETYELFQAIMQTTPDGIIIADSDKNIVRLNKGARQLFGYSEEEILSSSIPFGRLIPELGRDSSGGFEESPTGEYRMTGKPVERVGVNRRGKEFPLEISVSINETTKRTFYVGVIRDITIRRQFEEKLKQSVEKLQTILKGTIKTLSETVRLKDSYTAAHQHRVASLAGMMAEELGFPDDRVEGIRMAGEIHDLGKISVPSDILNKSTKLTDLEFLMIKSHPQVGYDLLNRIDFPWPIAKIVLQHHERLDGSGYPNGLPEEHILPEAKIITIADVVEAMAARRPYREAKGIDAALDEIERNSGKLYDPDMARACLHLFHDKGFTLNSVNELN